MGVELDDQCVCSHLKEYHGKKGCSLCKLCHKFKLGGHFGMWCFIWRYGRAKQRANAKKAAALVDKKL